MLIGYYFEVNYFYFACNNQYVIFNQFPIHYKVLDYVFGHYNRNVLGLGLGHLGQVLGLGLGTFAKSLALALALRPESLALALALRLESLALALALRLESLALALAL